MAYKLKMHLADPSNTAMAICGQFSKRPIRTSNVCRMEACKKCRQIRQNAQRSK